MDLDDSSAAFPLLPPRRGAISQPSRHKAGSARRPGKPHLRCIELIWERTHVPRSPPQTKKPPLGRFRPHPGGGRARGAAADEGGGASCGRASSPNPARQRRGPAALPAAPPGRRAPTGKPRLARKAPGSHRRFSRGAPGPPACLSPARTRCPGRDTAPRPGPSPRLRRSRVRITLRSGSRHGAILSPGAAARPRPPSPGRGLPDPATSAPPA